MCYILSQCVQLYALGYGHINTLQSVFVADQFTEEEVRFEHLIPG